MVVAFAHHAHHRLGAGRADHQPAVGTELEAARLHRAGDLLLRHLAAGGEAHVLEHLRHRLEAPAHLRHRPVAPLHQRHHLERCHQPVAGGRVVGQDDVAGLLAAEVVAVEAHVLQHVAVADGGAGQRQADGGEVALQPEVGHQRRHDAGLAELAVLLPVGGDRRHQLVAVDDPAGLVDDQHAVGVSVERDADVGAHLPHLPHQGVRRGGADAAVDVEAVRLDADGEHLGAEFPQGFGRDAVGGAVGAVDHDAQPVERQVARQGHLGELDVARDRVVDALGAAQQGRRGQLDRLFAVDEALDPQLDLVGQLVAVRTEQLDAVVLEGVMRGGDHDADVGAHGAGQHGHRRRGHGAEQQHVHANAGEAGLHGGLDHVARQPRVLADHGAVTVLAAHEQDAGGLGDLHREVGGDGAVGLAPDTVGAEMLACHERVYSSLRERPVSGFSLW